MRVRVTNRNAERHFAPTVPALIGIVVVLLLASPNGLMANDLVNDTHLRKMTDDIGRVVAAPQPVARIVSLAPSVTETIFALGEGDRLVGDTDFCDFPAEAKRRTHVGGPVNPSIERIAALRPDLVLISRSINRLSTVESLERLGIAVYVTDAHTVAEVLASTQRLGSVLGVLDGGDALVASLRQRLAAVQRRIAGAEPKRVLMVVWQEPLISVGRDTFLADALRQAGARSIVDAAQDWPNISLEEVVRLQPEYLIFSSDDPGQLRDQLAKLRKRPGWNQLNALRQGHVIVVSEALNHPSPRLVDAIEQLARALYPERFANSNLPFGASAFMVNSEFAVAATGWR